MNVLVTGVALLLAFASFVAYDAVSFRNDLAHQLQTESQILGANTVSALQFQDKEAATATLAGLDGSREVIWAVLLGRDGRMFAQYVRDGSDDEAEYKPLPAYRNEAQWVVDGNLLYGSRVMFDGRQVGTIYILAGMQDQAQRSRLYAAIAALVLLVCMGISLLLTSAFRRLLTEPLVGLAQTAQIVRTQKNYGVRAKTSDRKDEVAVLERSFNEMLDDLQERDRALEESRAVLEETVQKRTAELSATNQELEAFSYTVAHDLRGPLETMANIGYLLKESYGPRLDDEGRMYLDALMGSTRKMSALIQDLLRLSRSSRATFHGELLDLSQLVAGIGRQLAAAEPERHVELKVGEGVMVFGDAGLLCVAMENLLGNAWKYTSKEALAKIEFGVVDGGVKDAVGPPVYFLRDNGAGFDPAYADRLFQPFQRLHVQSEFPGTGIGLTTVARIISRHGGKIWAEGNVHRGATFFFTIPYAGRDSA